MQSVNIHEAKTHLSRLVEAARGGEEIIIAKAGRPAAKLVPVEGPGVRAIRFGLMKGEIAVANDFDAPLPEDIMRVFEGEP